MKHKILLLMVLSLFAASAILLAQDGDRIDFEKTFTLSGRETADIVLDIDAGRVDVQPWDSPDQVKVVMTYTEDAFREDVDFDERRQRVKIQLDSRKWKKWHSYDGDDEDNHADVEVYLPRNVALCLTSKISAGDIDMELGGLTLKELSFTNFAGEVELRFSESNRTVMEYMEIDAKVGETYFGSLGNARFKRADINAGIGEMEVDLTGALEIGAKAKIDLDIGEATVILPEDFAVRVRVGGGLSFLSSKEIDHGLRKRGGTYINDEYDNDDDALLVRVTPGLGQLNIRLE